MAGSNAGLRPGDLPHSAAGPQPNRGGGAGLSGKRQTTEDTENTEKENRSAAGPQPNRGGGAGLSGKRQTTEDTEDTARQSRNQTGMAA